MELMRKRSLREGFVFVGSGVMMYVKVMGNSTIVPDTLYFTVSIHTSSQTRGESRGYGSDGQVVRQSVQGEHAYGDPSRQRIYLRQR